MEYKLAKELKDAGFSFMTTTDDNKLYLAIFTTKDIVDFHGRQLVKFDDEWFYVPTLSELIEACGERNDDERLGTGEFTLWSEEGVWEAGYKRISNDETYLHPEAQGKTPEEAVAKLWLELNKKDDTHHPQLGCRCPLCWGLESNKKDE